MASYHTLRWLPEGRLELLDQRRLPDETRYLTFGDPAEVAGAIRDMVVRGAPAIGATAAYGMTLAAMRASGASDVEAARRLLDEGAVVLRGSRPTAVNLFWAVDRMEFRLREEAGGDFRRWGVVALEEANRIAREDEAANRAIGRHALSLVPDPARIIHHCNTGTLATVEFGTALGVIRAAHEAGRRVEVLVDETRPRLQGARLTAWELDQLGIPYRVIVDGASGHYLRRGAVDFCVVGADRIAANGDTANKIGTYNLAVVARENGVPFYVAAPMSTVDFGTPDGDGIPIEERGSEEVIEVGGIRIAPEGARAGNPAFDVTPARYITAILTDRGVVRPPFDVGLAAARDAAAGTR